MALKIVLKLTFVVILQSDLLHAQEHGTPVQNPSNNTASITLEASPPEVFVNVDANVTLECKTSGSMIGKYVEVLSVHIQKEENSQWEQVAEINKVDAYAVVKTNPNITASGLYDSDSVTFSLTITWDIGTEETLGRYRCTVNGWDPTTSMKSEEIYTDILRHIPTGQDVYELYLNYQRELEQHKHDLLVEYQAKFDDLNQTISENLKKLSRDQETLEAQLEYYKNETLMCTIATHIPSFIIALPTTTVTATPLNTSWPDGAYGLLKRNTGCPDQSNWKEGYIRFHTTSKTNNSDEVSSTDHLGSSVAKVGSDNFMIQYFCVLEDHSNGRGWPKGSYCINRVGGFCPPGFYHGYVNVDEENENYKGDFSGTVPDHERTMTHHYIDYCCRSDGSRDIEIELPTESPFYLYRYQGRCQKVKDMTVEEEFMRLDTVDVDNDDEYFSCYHPDGNINDFELQLCYYYN